MPRLVTRLQMERMADVLLVAKASEPARATALSHLHARFRAEAGGAQWTCALRTAEWHRRVSGQWRPGHPPDRLAMDEEVARDLERLADRVGDPAAWTALDPRACERVAVQLSGARAARAIPLEVLDALHSRFRARDSSGAVFTVSLDDGSWKRLESGAWHPAPAPAAVQLARTFLAELELLLGPAPRPEPAPSPVTLRDLRAPAREEPAAPPRAAAAGAKAFCTHCGLRKRTGVRFCTQCGNPV